MTFVLGIATLVVVLTRACASRGWSASGWRSCPTWTFPSIIKPPLWILMFFIEVAGLLIRHIVLAVRFFANMFAGHVVLSVILGFTVMAWSSMAFWLVMPVSIGGVICLSLLELFVALLQAYVFTFLSAMFIGLRHPH